MKKFRISVNGKSYDVEVEEIGAQSSAPVYTAPAAKPAQTSTVASAQPETEKKPQPAPKSVSSPAGSTVVAAPMPSTIMSVNVSVGDTVKKGQVLVILEAMKMENEIMAPSDGKVVAVNTSKGATVNTGDALVSLG